VLVDIDSGEIVYRAFNTRKDGDPTAHGEINALRGAGLAGIDLTRTVLFSTAEPCPMCAAACAWARVAGVVYGTTVESLIAFGWHQFGVTIEAIVDSSPFPPVPWVGGYMAELTDPLFSDGPPVIATDPVYAR
jgi:tRNA(Arg) A34 adenosine deaminase TadA